MQALVINASRDTYRASESARHTLTVQELRWILDQYDDDAPVILSHDGGYTYGKIKEDRFEMVELTDED